MKVNKKFSARWSLVLLVLLAVPATAADGVIQNGVDAWLTSDGGRSFMDFAYDPIPAGFFCSGSAPFIGRIAWRGVPLATSPPDVFGVGVDTIIRRVDDAVFDRGGVATTRLQVAALSLESIEPIQTSCGLYAVRATLAPGEQPMTEMRIVRTRKHGGYFQAPLEFNARLTFTPVGVKRSEFLEIDRTIFFPAAVGARWTDRPRKAVVRVKGFALVDTDGDGAAETFLPGTSNFFPLGSGARSGGMTKVAEVEQQPCLAKIGEVCHWYSAYNKCHCTILAEPTAE